GGVAGIEANRGASIGQSLIGIADFAFDHGRVAEGERVVGVGLLPGGVVALGLPQVLRDQVVVAGGDVHALALADAVAQGIRLGDIGLGRGGVWRDEIRLGGGQAGVGHGEVGIEAERV